MTRRHIIILICAVVGILAWKFLPGTALDRGLFSLTARCFAKPPLFISGHGGYTLRTFKKPSGKPPGKLPAIVSLGDDPEGFFQSSPPSPVDFAIILKNLNRLGRKGPVLGIPLAWDEVDTISLVALDQQLDALPDVVTCAPLTRNPVPTPIPPGFRRASIPIENIHGDTKLLPIVNRVPIPDVILGNKSSLAGFTTLESEQTASHPHLLARWEGEEKVVLSLPLLAAMNAYQVGPESLEVHLGKYISLSSNGPYIPIDKYGRLAFAPPVVTEKQSVPAPALIDAPDDIFTKTDPAVVILRNDLSSSQASSGKFSKSLVGTVAAMVDPSYTTELRTYARLAPYVELLFLASLLCLIYGLENNPAIKEKYAFIGIAVSIILLHFFFVPLTHTWLPTLPALIMTAIGALTLVGVSKSAVILPISLPQKETEKPIDPPSSTEKNIAAPEPKPEPVISPVSPEINSVKTPPARKTAAKRSTTKTPAKKVARKTPTKKAVKKVAKKAAKKAAKKTARKNPAKKFSSKPAEE